jgi:hypothetical protein
VDHNGTCGAGHPGAADFLLTDGVEEVVARMKMVKSVGSFRVRLIWE